MESSDIVVTQQSTSNCSRNDDVSFLSVLLLMSSFVWLVFAEAALSYHLLSHSIPLVRQRYPGMADQLPDLLTILGKIVYSSIAI